MDMSRWETLEAGSSKQVPRRSWNALQLMWHTPQPQSGRAANQPFFSSSGFTTEP